MIYVFVGVALLAMVLIGVIAYHIGRSGAEQEKNNKEQDARYNGEIVSKNQQIRSLNDQVENLNRLNTRYLSFMVNVSSIVKWLNVALKSDEIISSIIRLVCDMISTDKVEVYIFDATDNLLKKLSSSGQAQEEQVSYALGEGLIGLAARDRMVRVRGQNTMGFHGRKDAADNSLWMAVPITSGDQLFGVIGIGRVKNPVGSESTLMMIIADIAGMALIHRSFLGEAQQKANTDPLTGLFNRRYFFKVANQSVERAIKEGSTISIFLFDIDNFKNYNDTNGHGEGDKLLKELSNLVRGMTRKTSVLARYGGEEFIVLLPAISKEDALIYADRVREMISLHSFPCREKQPLGCVSISGGIASFPIDGNSITKVLQFADRALYRAKAEGKNRVLLHEPFLFSEPDSGIDDLKGS